jgi:hypothetical protein
MACPLTGCGNTVSARQNFDGPHVWDDRRTPGRRLKKADQQGRSESRAESNPLGYVEGLNDARTPPGERRVSARLGLAGEKSDFFSLLLNMLFLHQLNKLSE